MASGHPTIRNQSFKSLSAVLQRFPDCEFLSEAVFEKTDCVDNPAYPRLIVQRLSTVCRVSVFVTTLPSLTLLDQTAAYCRRVVRGLYILQQSPTAE